MKPLYPGRPRKPLRTDGKKHCVKCKTEKDLENDFYPSSSSPDGHQPYCKICDNLATSTSYRNNLKVNRAKRRKWQDEHHDEHLAHVRAYYARKRAEKKRVEETASALEQTNR